MFDKQKYYKYINDIKFEIGLIYFIYVTTATILALLLANESSIISIGIFILGILFASIQTKSLEIKIQEMYFRLEIYEKVITRKEA